MPVPFFILLLALGAPQGGDPLTATIQHALEFSAAQLDAATSSIASTRYPSTTTSAGTWATTGPGDWTSGFFPGCLWLLHDWSRDPRWRAEAEAWLGALEGEKDDSSTHDVGFKILPSFGNAYRLTGLDAQRRVVLDGAASLAARYSPIVRATRSWNGPTSSDFRVIIDNMMNLELLFSGARNGGDPAWYDMAVNHALTTRAHHVRADGSTYQVVNFDAATGGVKSKGTHQGHDAESTWSRGQGWAVHGFTTAFRESGDPRFLDTARATAEYFVAHLPADAVPYWDFELPSTSGEPRDSSAAAVAAAGLLELSRLEPDPVRAQRWLDAARAILTSLASPAYLAEGSGEDSILLHGTQNRPDGRLDTGLIYGDYYFLQALLRHQRWFGLAPVAVPLALETSAGTPLEIELAASDAQECELVFSIAEAPLHGGLGVLAPRPCQAGAPNRDAARVIYFPAPGFAGTDSFSYVAGDGTHASEPATVAIDVLAGGSSTFLALADSKVSSSSPARNYGSETTLRVRASSPEWRTYVQFQVGGLSGPVTGARLRLFATDGSDSAGRVFAVASTWTEEGITWNGAPGLGSSALATGGAVAGGAWTELDVGAAFTAGARTSVTYSFALTSSSTDSAYFSSREGAHPPELVLTVGRRQPRAASEHAPAPPD